MHVKRHLSRLFGSLRRKDHKNIGDKVLDQLQSRENKTSSRWELLDYEHPEGPVFLESKTDSGNSTTTTYAYGDGSGKSDKKESNEISLSYQKVKVELNGINPHNFIQTSTRLTKGIGRSLSKRLRKSPSDCSNTIKSPNKTDDDGDYEKSLNVSALTPAKSVTSIVKQINETICLISEFQAKPEQKPDDPIEKENNIDFDEGDVAWPTNINVVLSPNPRDKSNEVKSVSDDNNLHFASIKSTRPSRNKSNPDTITIRGPFHTAFDSESEEDEGTRLTRHISAQSSQREVINLARNEATRAWTVFAPPDEHEDSSRKHPTFPLASSESGRESDDLCIKSSATTAINGTTPLSEWASRPWAESDSQIQRNSEMSNSTGIRNSGRRLYNKIHKRFRKKASNTSQDSVREKTTTDTANGYTSTSIFTTQEKKEIKSIGTGGRLTRSFRKAKALAFSQSFQPLDNLHKDSVRVGFSRENTKTKTGNNIEQDDDNGNGIEEEGGPVKVRRKLSIKALGRPGRGMGKMLKKGVTAFGKSMVHASAVMPLPYECPQNSNYSPSEPYWEDEDYFYEFRRYCQSAQSEYQMRFAEAHQFTQQKQKFYQHGYCP